jgi:hypothetical protein
MTSLILLSPTAGGRVSNGYADTLARLTLACARREMRLERQTASDGGQLVHARNVLYQAACDSDATHALWWDADVSFDPELLFALLDRPEPMIARPYPCRAPDWSQVSEFMRDRPSGAWGPDDLRAASLRWTTTLHFENGKPVWSEDRKLVELESSGFGWVLMHVQEMRSMFGDDWGEPERDWNGRRVGAPLFNLLSDPICGEDVSFCRRWRRSRRIWCAPEGLVQNAEHVGDYAAYLRRTFA